MAVFQPDYRFRRAWDIPPEWLRDKGITVLLLDVDNTLTTHDNPDVADGVHGWLARMRAAEKRADAGSGRVSDEGPGGVSDEVLEQCPAGFAASPPPRSGRRARGPLDRHSSTHEVHASRSMAAYATIRGSWTHAMETGGKH